MNLYYGENYEKIIISIFFIFPSITFAQNNPIEPCSFESNNLWIKLVQLCPEGELVCDKVIYIGLNKKTGDFITLQGKTVVSKRNNNFLYYEFINNDTKYIIDRNNFLEIIKDNKTILSQKMQLCP